MRKPYLALRKTEKSIMQESRHENQIFHDLEKLCTSVGYIHAIAYLCWRDNFIRFGKELKPDDLDHLKSGSCLLRTEISTLIGLMVKAPIDLTLPSPDIIQGYIEQTEKLLDEIHQSMNYEFFKFFQKPDFDRSKDNPFKEAKLLREPIFYGGESAYSFQYRDFCVEKYDADREWFVANKGFSPEDVRNFINGVGGLPAKKIAVIKSQFKPENINELTLLPAFKFSKEEISSITGQNISLVERIIKAFSVPLDSPAIKDFDSVSAFNITNAYPIIPLEDGTYLLFQFYSIAEAFYETPFFWMREDSTYVDIAMKNRGIYAEEFSVKRLQTVFRKERIYKNVCIVDKQGKDVGEIDVLVIYADRAIIIQAKSKKLTIEARKGNDNALKKDFRDGIQAAYEQGFRCAEYLLDGNYHLVSSTGEHLSLSRKYAEVFIFCVLSDHYPGLAFQTDQLLEFKNHSIIRPPYVMDVFFLDVLCEFLDTPLQFLNYVHRRAGYTKTVLSSNELTVLSYHLAYNLWVDKNEFNMMMLGEDISVHLDSAILVRREGLPGQSTPHGILTKFKGSFFETILNEISTVEKGGTIDLGYFLLELNEATIKEISKITAFITEQTRKDKGLHDFSIGVEDSGLTVHCSIAAQEEAYKVLYAHCERRKYATKAARWFGIALNPNGTPMIRMAMGLKYPWKQSDALDIAVKDLSKENYKNLSEALHRKKIQDSALEFARTGLNRKQRRLMRAKERRGKR